MNVTHALTAAVLLCWWWAKWSIAMYMECSSAHRSQTLAFYWTYNIKSIQMLTCVLSSQLLRAGQLTGISLWPWLHYITYFLSLCVKDVPVWPFSSDTKAILFMRWNSTFHLFPITWSGVVLWFLLCLTCWAIIFHRLLSFLSVFLDGNKDFVPTRGSENLLDKQV